MPPNADPSGRTANLTVVLASAGRPSLLAEAIRHCEGQRDTDFHGVLSVPDEDSLPPRACIPDRWRVVLGVRGLAAQRNAALDALASDGVVAFFDDDAVPRPDYLSRAVRFLDAHPEVVALTGRVLLDGAVSGEIDMLSTTTALQRSDEEPERGTWAPTREIYGCNFVVDVGKAQRVRFDERLPLYSWLEDHDFARRCRQLGVLAKVDDCVVVHRAAASGGRQNHRRLGYSQVMNAVYLMRKGSFPLWLTVQQIFRPVAKNLALSLTGPSARWRRERLRGNTLAAWDVVRGRITPERIASL